MVQHTEVSLNMTKTEFFSPDTQNANYAELINSIKLLLPATNDFIPKSTEMYNYFYDEQSRSLMYSYRKHSRKTLSYEKFVRGKKTKTTPLSLLQQSEQVGDFHINIDVSKSYV